MHHEAQRPIECWEFLLDQRAGQLFRHHQARHPQRSSLRPHRIATGLELHVVVDAHHLVAYLDVLGKRRQTLALRLVHPTVELKSQRKGAILPHRSHVA